MSDFTLGRHEEAINTLVESNRRIEAKLGEIEKYMSERKGERRIAIWMAGAVGALAVKLVGAVTGLFS